MLEAAYLDAARSLIAADSVTDRGNLRAVQVLEPLCGDAGLIPTRLPSPDTADRDANLLAGPGGGPGAVGDPLLLVTHLDTVDPGPREHWRTDPFSLEVQGDRAFGLGVADVKLDALCKLWAARRLKGVALRRPFYFLGTYGEEAGLRGARAFMEAPPFRPSVVLCGEPSELRICHAHKGYAVARVTIRRRAGTAFAAAPARIIAFEGKAAHSSTPHLGVNAIDAALEALSRPGAPYVMHLSGGASANTIPARCEAVVYWRPGCVPSPAWTEPVGASMPPENSWANVTDMLPLVKELRVSWTSRVMSMVPASDSRFAPATAVANLTRVSTTGSTLDVTFDARLLPGHDVEALVTGFEQDAIARSDAAFEVRVAIDRRASGMSLAEDAPLVRTCGEVLERLGLSGAPKAKPTSTEAGVFARAGIPAIVFGPSLSTGNAHTANEHARLDEVERAVEVYERFIRALCA